jgi:hypothetical protein
VGDGRASRRTEKVQGLELDERTLEAISSRGSDSIARGSKDKARRKEPPSGMNRFFGKTNVTAEAVTYNARSRIEERRPFEAQDKQECLRH